MSSNNNSGYSYNSSGTNSQVSRGDGAAQCACVGSGHLQLITTYQGNHYCSRDYGSSDAISNSYHYSNTNPNGSTYHQSSSGTSTYTTPGGDTYRSSGGSSGGKK
ncbi:hypothetical protein PG997_010492 [Apiospora hydei]|uniref:Uncharacterized protein n=1 Tax=Apiospora hydei TaxID=1337664 RepID=A0ABR1W0X0_9PEZI